MDIRAIRKELGMTQREFAEALGMSHCGPNISNYERGVRPLSIGMAARIALLRIAKKVEGEKSRAAQNIREIIADLNSLHAGEEAALPGSPKPEAAGSTPATRAR